MRRARNGLQASTINPLFNNQICTGEGGSGHSAKQKRRSEYDAWLVVLLLWRLLLHLLAQLRRLFSHHLPQHLGS